MERQTELTSEDGRWCVVLMDFTESLGKSMWCVFGMNGNRHWPAWTLDDDGDPYAEHEPGELNASDVLTMFFAAERA